MDVPAGGEVWTVDVSAGGEGRMVAFRERGA